MKTLLLAAWLLTAFHSWSSAATRADYGRPGNSDSSCTHNFPPLLQVPTKPLLRFENFKASNFYTGKPAKINYKSHLIARQYRTVITAGYKEGGVNFGGHYRFIVWGCGSSCAQSALIDLRNGLVYEGPIMPAGFDFKADSRLLLGNPPNWTLTKVYELETEYWVWSEARHTFEQQLPRYQGK